MVRRYIETARQIINNLISKYPRAVESYEDLEYYYLVEYGKLPWLTKEQFIQLKRSLKRLRTIERTFRKMVRDGEIRLPLVEQERRQRLADKFRRALAR